MAERSRRTGKIVGVLIAAALVIVALQAGGILDKLLSENAGGPAPATIMEAPAIDREAAGEIALRLGHWTWNSHQAWALANHGKETAPDSLFAKNKIRMGFVRIEDIPVQINALVSFAQGFKAGEANPADGVHFFTIMGDASGWVLNDTNKALKGVDPVFQAEIVGFGGFSAGEDKLMGPPAWKQDPQAARGGLVAGVPADGDWNVMIYWCVQNDVPFNSDKRLYDPGALNFLQTENYIKAAEVYIAGQPVELTFKEDGKDFQGKTVKKGERGFVAITGSVTWTPGDKNIADQRGGLVSIASTREYSEQMPQYIVGLKQWNDRNQSAVIRMLASVFAAADQIKAAAPGLKSGAIQPRAAADVRWTAAGFAQQIFGSEDQEYWYKYFDVVTIADKQGLQVEIGGSAVSNLEENLRYFGLAGGENQGRIMYERFAKLAMQYYPDFMESYAEWSSVFNPVYVQGVKKNYPELIKS
ncbi:MAG: hypothetical protein HYV63_22715 [Candidatus Schekmanbacteria bacterium]|nr:hypothetical protein [Candidatus Schekmanbacteria bacterium]